MAALGRRLLGLRAAVGRRGAQSQGPPGPPANPQVPPQTRPYPGVVESTAEFAFVERLIPPSRVPDPPVHPTYPTPSGWSPPRAPDPALPYFVRRSRMHNVPVYRHLRAGTRRTTVLRRIEGDIWALEAELRAFVGQRLGREPLTQVNEVTGTLRLKGHVDAEVRAWLLQKGF